MASMNDWRPDRKVTGGAVGIGIPAGIIIAWALETFVGVTVPMPVATAFGGFISAVAAYLLPDER